MLNTFPPEALAAHWPEIREILAAIPAAKDFAALYRVLGAKYRPEDIGIDPARKREVLDLSAAIRNRLTLMRMRRLIAE